MGFLSGVKAFLEGLLLRPIDNRPIGLGPIHEMSDEVLLNQLASPATPRPQFNVKESSTKPGTYQFSTIPTPVPPQPRPVATPSMQVAKPPKKDAVAPAFARVPTTDYTFKALPPRFNPWTQKTF